MLSALLFCIAQQLGVDCWRDDRVERSIRGTSWVEEGRMLNKNKQRAPGKTFILDQDLAMYVERCKVII